MTLSEFTKNKKNQLFQKPTILRLRIFLFNVDL